MITMSNWSLLMTVTAALLSRSVIAQEENQPPEFPVEPILFVDEPFNSCEGIAFNGEGQMYVTCNQGLWRVDKSADATRIADLDSDLGVAGIGDKDVLVADFGPTNAFQNGRNSDGIVWRITPDGTYLVSDDATSDIYVVQPDGQVDLFTTAVNHPNGMVLSLDESTLYVAQMFTNIRPVVGVNLIWAIRLKDGKPVRDAKLVTTTGPGAFVDGLAMDRLGRVYITANREGRIWRFDPESEELIIITENVYGAASVVFGEGKFDKQSIYITTTFSRGRGGKVWRVPVGIEGASVVR